MSCKCSIQTDEYHGYACAVTGGSCVFIVPDAVQCAIQYGEGPYSDRTPEELTILINSGHSILNEIAIKCAEAGRIECEREQREDEEMKWDGD